MTLTACIAVSLGSVLLLAPPALAKPDKELLERAATTLERGVKSGDFDTRAAAVAGLGNLPKKRALPLVTDALTDPQWAVRAAAIGALRDLRDTRAWEKAVIAALRDLKIDVSLGSLPLLEPLGAKRGAALLVKALRTDDFPKPERVAIALAQRGGDWMVEGYRAALRARGPFVAAFEAQLTRLPLPDALPLWKDGLAKRTPEVQRELLARLAAHAEDAGDVAFIAPLLKSSDADIAFETARLLARYENRAGRAVLVAAAESADDARRLAALRALEPIATADLFDIVRPIVTDRSADLELLLAAYAIFHKGKNPKLAAYLDGQLTNTDINQRAAAVAYIGEVKGRAAIDDLVPLLGAGPLVIRVQAARSLGRLGQRAAIQPLQRALQSATDKEFKLALLAALADVKDAEIIPVVRFYLNDFDKDVQRAAVRALTLVPHESGVPDLEQALQSRDREIRVMALEALVKQDPERNLRQFTSALQWIDPGFVTDLVKSWKGQARPHLEAALASSRDDMRAAALAATRHLDEADQQALTATLVREGKRDELRVAALDRHVELAGRAAAPLLAELARGDHAGLKVAALEHLGRVAPRDHLDLLIAALDDPAERLRVIAAGALVGL